MRKANFIILFLVMAVFMLSIVRTFVANNIATSGVVLSQVETKTKELETENAIIAQKLYTQTSLAEISSKAAELGFTETSKTFAITTQNPVAFKQ